MSNPFVYIMWAARKKNTYFIYTWDGLYINGSCTDGTHLGFTVRISYENNSCWTFSVWYENFKMLTQKFEFVIGNMIKYGFIMVLFIAKIEMTYKLWTVSPNTTSWILSGRWSRYLINVSVISHIHFILYQYNNALLQKTKSYISYKSR